MSNIVYTFHHEVSRWTQQKKLIELWKYSWEKYGWETRVLGINDAQMHWAFDEITNSTWLRKSRNTWETLVCCYYKYLAMTMLEASDTALFCDPDVINYGYIPEELSAPTDIMMMYEKEVPCMLSGTRTAWLDMSIFFFNCSRLKYCGYHCIRDDLNDMNLIRDFMTPNQLVNTTDLVVQCDLPLAATAQLVHYPYHYISSMDRTQHIIATRKP